MCLVKTRTAGLGGMLIAVASAGLGWSLGARSVDSAARTAPRAASSTEAGGSTAAALGSPVVQSSCGQTTRALSACTAALQAARVWQGDADQRAADNGRPTARSTPPSAALPFAPPNDDDPYVPPED